MELSQTQKINLWTRFYEADHAVDPSLSTIYTLKLIEIIRANMAQIECHDYDALLTHLLINARQAWADYNEGERGKAMQTVCYVLGKVQFLVYDPKYSESQVIAFSGKGL
jgi:hypothetical protein